MTKVFVASFTDEKKATAAFSKLNELESSGDISLYDKRLVSKRADGTYQTLQVDSHNDWRALGGMAVGGLLGTLGGPIGFVVGLYAGAAVGAFAEIKHYEFEGDFINNVENIMAAGTVSIIAEIDDADSDFITISLEPIGAVILKSNVDFQYGNYMNEQVEAIEDAISEQRASLKKAAGAEKGKIEQHIEVLKENRKAKLAVFDSTMKKAVHDVSGITVSGIDKIKTEFEKISTHVNGSMDDGKANRIKRNIARQEAKLKNLQNELEVLADR